MYKNCVFTDFFLSKAPPNPKLCGNTNVGPIANNTLAGGCENVVKHTKERREGINLLLEFTHHKGCRSKPTAMAASLTRDQCLFYIVCITAGANSCATIETLNRRLVMNVLYDIMHAYLIQSDWKVMYQAINQLTLFLSFCELLDLWTAIMR